MLVEGFDQLGTMATIYNHPYYAQHLQKLGYVQDAEWVEYRVTIPDTVPERLRRISELVLKRHKLRILKYSSASKLVKDGYVQKLFELVNDSYSHLYGFTPLTQAQIDYYTKLYIPMLNLKYLVLVVNEGGDLVAMGVTMPSLSQALRKAQGKLFPFGVLHLLKALKMRNPVIDCLLVAVRKDYQNKGVNSLIFYDIIPHLRRAGAMYAESNPRTGHQYQGAVTVGRFRACEPQASAGLRQGSGRSVLRATPAVKTVGCAGSAVNSSPSSAKPSTPCTSTR